MLTPGYSATATERVLPKLALDFTTGTLDPRVTVTRALNTATRINSSGLLTGVNANLPRFDYDYTTLSAKGLLIEEARTNLITQSRDYSTITWTKTAINVSACPDPSPTGATDAQTLTNSGGTGLMTFVHAGTSGVAYTFSAWLRRRSGTGSVAMTDTNGNYIQLTLTSAWKRFTVVTTSSASTTIRAYIRVYTSGDEVDVYNSQLELGSFATSDIFTAGSTVARNADVVSMTGTNFSDWYNATEGTFYVQGIPTTTASSGALSIDDGTGNERMQMRALGGGGQALVVDGGSTQVNLPTGTWPTGSSGKCVLAYKASSFACAVGGDAPATSASGTLPTVTQMQIGGGINQSYFNGRVQKIGYWPQRCINNEVRAFSKG